MKFQCNFTRISSKLWSNCTEFCRNTVTAVIKFVNTSLFFPLKFSLSQNNQWYSVIVVINLIIIQVEFQNFTEITVIYQWNSRWYIWNYGDTFGSNTSGVFCNFTEFTAIYLVQWTYCDNFHWNLDDKFGSGIFCNFTDIMVILHWNCGDILVKLHKIRLVLLTNLRWNCNNSRISV